VNQTVNANKEDDFTEQDYTNRPGSCFFQRPAQLSKCRKYLYFLIFGGLADIYFQTDWHCHRGTGKACGQQFWRSGKFTLGISILLGGIKYKSLKFNIENASMNATMLTLAIITLAIPTAFSFQATDSFGLKADIERIIFVSAVILFVIYLCSILFSAYTHKHLFVERYEKEMALWSVRTSILVMPLSLAFLLP
jgi:hypothetical protein